MPFPAISYLGQFAQPGNLQAARPPRIEHHSVASWYRTAGHPRIWVPCECGRWYARGRWIVMGPVLRHYLPDVLMQVALVWLLMGMHQANGLSSAT